MVHLDPSEREETSLFAFSRYIFEESKIASINIHSSSGRRFPHLCIRETLTAALGSALKIEVPWPFDRNIKTT